MTTKQFLPRTHSRSILIYVYLLVAFSIFVSAFVAGALIYFSSQVQRIERQSNEYHLATRLNVSRIESELNKIALTLIETRGDQIIDNEYRELRRSAFIIDRHKHAIEKTQRRFAHSDIEGSTQRFLNVIDELDEAIWERQSDLVKSLPALALAQVRSEQLRQIHTNAFRDNKAQSLQLSDPGRLVGWIAILVASAGFPILLLLGMSRRAIRSRLNAEATLAASESRYRTLVDAAPISIHEIDEHARITSMNATGIQIFGVQHPTDIIGHRYLNFVETSDRARVKSLMQRAFEGEATWTEFTSCVDGETKILSSSFIPIFNEHETVEKLMGTLENITQRRTAETALRCSEEQFRQLAENVNAVFWMRSGDGQQLYVSPKYEEIWGRSMDSITEDADSFVDAVVAEDRPQLLHAYDSLCHGGLARNHEVEYRIRRLDGETRWIRDRSFPIRNDRGEIIRQARFAEDVTERKNAEEALRRKEAELFHVSRLSSMGEMVAGIAHEINQPLAAIANFALACKTTIKKTNHEFEDPVEQWLDQINLQAVRCGDIIRNLRNFLKIDESELSWTDLNQVVRDSVALLRNDLRTKTPVVECHLPDQATEVYASHIQLQQVVINLLRNACDATSKLISPRISIAVENREGGVCLTVEDNGPGIDETQQQKLFDTFYTTKANGLGMGLAISKSIVESHGGSLRLDPESHVGAKFHLKLPASSPKKQRIEHAG